MHLQKGEAIRQIGQCLDCPYCFIFVRVLILLLIREATELFSPKIKHRIPCGFLPLNTDKQRSNCLWEPDMKYFIHFFFFFWQYLNRVSASVFVPLQMFIDINFVDIFVSNSFQD